MHRFRAIAVRTYERSLVCCVVTIKQFKNNNNGFNKERVQLYRGVVIKISGHGDKKRFTVRKMSGTVGVERIFPIESPAIDSIEVNKVGKVRRAKLYYLRALTGKKARIKEKRVNG